MNPLQYNPLGLSLRPVFPSNAMTNAQKAMENMLPTSAVEAAMKQSNAETATLKVLENAMLGQFEIKGEEDDPNGIVTKALETLQASVDDRLKGIEAKAGETDKLADRIKELEIKSNRPVGEKDKVEPTEERKAFGAYLRQGKEAGPDVLKTLVVSSDPQGGYLAPPEMSTEFIRDLVEFSPIRSVASVATTGSPSVIYPKRTSGTSALWKGETQAQEASEPTFGQAEITVKELNTFVDVSNQLLADSAGTAEAEVRMALAEDFGKKEALAFINGDGVLQPMGLMNDPNIGFAKNGHATILSADALVSFLYSIPATYRNAGSWAMNGTTLGILRTLKDGAGNYLWQPSFQIGQPETILGRPVVEMLDMPDIAANAFPIIFGDFSGYRIVDRVGLSILVNPYLLATNGITRIHATRRVGGGVLQPAKFKKLKMAV